MNVEHLQVTLSLTTLVAVLGLWGTVAVDRFKLRMMWKDYCQRHGINGLKDSNRNDSSQ